MQMTVYSDCRIRGGAVCWLETDKKGGRDSRSSSRDD